MKVYSWKTLLVTILCGGSGLAYAIVNLRRYGSLAQIVWIIIFGMSILEGLGASLTEEGHREDEETGKRGKRLYGALFGKLAPVMPYGALICLLVGAVCARAFPEQAWPFPIFVLAGLAYQLWLASALKKEAAKEHLDQEG